MDINISFWKASINMTLTIRYSITRIKLVKSY